MRLALRNGHVQIRRGRVQLCRLRGSSLFRAIGCDDPTAGGGRMRRAVKQHLLALDYWIAQPSRGDFLLGGHDKESFFAKFGIAEDSLPAGARSRKGALRFFPDRFPVRVPDEGRAVVEFAYAHAGSSEAGMILHLERHESLAMALWERGIACEWVVLADGEAQFARLHRAWQRWIRRLDRDWSEAEYFSLRLRAQKREWASLNRQLIKRYGRLAAAHRGRGVEKRFREWLRAGRPGRPAGGDFTESCSFREVLMEFDYSVADIAER